MEGEQLYRVLIVLIFIIFTGIRVYYRLKASKARQFDRSQEKPQFWTNDQVVRSFAIITYLISLLSYLLGLSWILSFQIPLLFIRWIGVLLSIMVIPLLTWIHRTLSVYYSGVLELHEDHVLITKGPYSRVRNPMYTVLNLFAFSLALISANVIILITSIVMMTTFPWHVRREEQMLLDRFGEKYREYMKHTGRFFPRIGIKKR